MYDSQKSQMHLKEVMLHRIDLAIRKAMPNERLMGAVRFDTYPNYVADCMVAEMRASIYGEYLEFPAFKVPEDWWEHFKEACMPNWFKKWFPVRYKTIVVNAEVVYPHVTAPDMPKALRLVAADIKGEE